MRDIFGSETFYYKGIIIPRNYWTHPKDLTPQEVFENPNAEVGAAGVEILVSVENKELNSFLKKIATDKWGVLYKITGFNQVLVLKVVNATPEPDGTFKDYFLLVPSDLTSPRAAVAWTFGKQAKDYNPVIQT